MARRAEAPAGVAVSWMGAPCPEEDHLLDPQALARLESVACDVDASDADVLRALHSFEGADAANVQLNNGGTLLHRLARMEGAGVAERIGLLARAGAKLEALRPWGEVGSVTPLALAAFEGCDGPALALLEAGADPNSRTESGYTVMHLAVRGGSPCIVRELVRRGVRTTEVNARGETAAEIGERILGAFDGMTLLPERRAELKGNMQEILRLLRER